MNKSKNKLIKIALTGGHAATTALAVVEELTRRGGEKYVWDIYWIGAKKAMEGKSIPSLESQVMDKAGVSFKPIVSGRLQRRFTLWTIPSIAKIPIGFIHALAILLKIKPVIIVSFGGFTSFPVVFVGKFLRIPVLIHEQTSAAGRANILASRYANIIAVSRKESLKYFPREKTVLVGNPILSQIAGLSFKENIADPPIIYITGGSRGSRPINEVIEEVLEKLLKEFYVIHQTGYLDFNKFRKLKKKLPKKLNKKYELYSQIDPMQMDGVYKRADIVIARAGANTVSEIIACKRPSILIPLPFTYLDEQSKNASFAEQFGVARVLSQENLSSDNLLKEVSFLKKNWKNIVNQVKKKSSPDIESSKKLVDYLEKLLRE